MAWGDFASADYAADTPGRQERGDYLSERDRILAGRPFTIENFAEASTTAADWTTDAADFYVRTPDYAVPGWFLHGRVYIKVAAGTGGMIRLSNTTDSNDGTAQTGISSAVWIWSDDLSVQVDAGPHTDINVKVQIQGDGANLMYTHLFSATYNYGSFWWEPS